MGELADQQVGGKSAKLLLGALSDLRKAGVLRGVFVKYHTH